MLLREQVPGKYRNTYLVWVSCIFTVQYCQVPLKCGLFDPDNDLSRYVNQNSRSEPSPHISPSRPSYGVYCADLGENWPRYNRIALYNGFLFKVVKPWRRQRNTYTRIYTLYARAHVISKRCPVWYGAVLVHNVRFVQHQLQPTYPVVVVVVVCVCVCVCGGGGGGGGDKMNPPSFLSSMNCTITWNSN